MTAALASDTRPYLADEISDQMLASNAAHVTGGSSADLEQAAAVFVAVRHRLFGIAYRMLGSATEAEDIVQDAWVRWQMCDRSAVVDPPAFLATTTTRLCLNAMQSAYARRETYVGPWLPEPVDTSADPLLSAERGEALEFATLMLLEKLPPTERAAYVLREAFDYPYAQIAQIVQVKAENARQLVSRARKHMATERCEPASPSEHKRLVEALVTAAQTGDLATLEELFAETLSVTPMPTECAGPSQPELTEGPCA